MTDLSGKVVLTGRLTSECTNINIEELINGIYLFKIGTLNKQTIKVLKK
jgi:hypothetical protein